MGSLGAGTEDPDEPFLSPRGCPPLPRDPRERGRGSQKEPPAAGLPEAEGRGAPQVAVPPPGTLPAARSPLSSRPPPRPTRRQEPGPEHSAGLTSPPPRCRLPSVLLSPPPRPRREPAPGAGGGASRLRPADWPGGRSLRGAAGSPTFLAEPRGAGSGRRWGARPVACGSRGAENRLRRAGRAVAALPGRRKRRSPRKTASVSRTRRTWPAGNPADTVKASEASCPAVRAGVSPGKLRTCRDRTEEDPKRGHPSSTWSSGGAQPRGCFYI